MVVTGSGIIGAASLHLLFCKCQPSIYYVGNCDAMRFHLVMNPQRHLPSIQDSFWIEGMQVQRTSALTDALLAWETDKISW